VCCGKWDFGGWGLGEKVVESEDGKTTRSDRATEAKRIWEEKEKR